VGIVYLFTAVSQTPSMFASTVKQKMFVLICFVWYMVLFRPFELPVGHHSGESAPCCLPLPGMRQCLVCVVSIGELHQICAVWSALMLASTWHFKSIQRCQESPRICWFCSRFFEIKVLKCQESQADPPLQGRQTKSRALPLALFVDPWDRLGARGHQHGVN